jgi:hypothetical protein
MYRWPATDPPIRLPDFPRFGYNYQVRQERLALNGMSGALMYASDTVQSSRLNPVGGFDAKLVVSF